MTHLEESLQRDEDRIRGNVLAMSRRAEQALNGCIKAFTENDRGLAYAVILRDLYIDEQEKELDRLCLEFLVRRQPVGISLRFAYSTIKVNLEIERVGDYAESIARHVLKLDGGPPEGLTDGIVEMARIATTMFHDSVRAFVERNADVARGCIAVEETVDSLRSQLNGRLVKKLRDGSMPYATFNPIRTIIRRFERVSDQARNICMETLYMCTGEHAKHPGAEAFHVLFVDETNSWRSQMAEAIGKKLNHPRFVFESAGIALEPVGTGVVEFMRGKGYDLSHISPKVLGQVDPLSHYHVIVNLSGGECKGLPSMPRKTVFLQWPVDGDGGESDSMQDEMATYERAYTYLSTSINELVEAVVKAESP